MHTIPLNQVNEVWERFNDANEEEAQAMAKRAQEAQPYILIYLLAMGENLEEGGGAGELLNLGAFALEAMYAAKPDLAMVTDVDLETAEQANLQHLETLDEGSEMDFESAIQDLVGGYNQMPLLSVLLEALMSGHEEAPELAPENLGMSLIYLKTIIDCLDQ